MGVYGGPEIPNDGLVLALDAANPRNFNLTAVEVLVVGGGGGGGRHSGGGGGAGGLIYNSNFAVTPGTQLTVTVGNGGASLYGTYPTLSGGNGINGGSSVFGSLEAIGGGGGGYYDSGGNVGGSGGGAGRNNTGANGTAGQGNSGGSGAAGGFTSPNYPAHGGGGAGGSGKIGSQSKGGDGGIGLLFNINGTPTYYAGGGGGNIQYTSALGGVGGLGGGGAGSSGHNGLPALYGTDGTPNTGGGGGGTHYDAPATGTSGIEGRGGSGIVIVRYPGPQKAIGGTITSVNGDTIHTFTTSGNFTPLVNTNGSAVLGLSDLSGNRNFGTTAGSPTYNSANGGSLSFEGSDEYVTTGGVIVPNSSSPYTVSVWCYRNRNNVGLEELLSQWTSANSGNSFFFGFDNSNVRFTDNWTPVTVPGAGNTGVWMNLVGVYSVSNAFIYLNGSLSATRGSGFSYGGTGNFIIGRQGELSSEYFSGQISVVRLYNRALSAAEITQNFNALRGRYFRPGSSSDNPATSASEILSTDPYANNGVYWIKPTGASSSFQAYVDFTTANGPWIHIGTAGGNLRGLYTYRDTWCSRTTNSGDITTPYNASASSFNAGSFIYCKGSLIMIKHNQDGYVQASGFNNESWRDVYNFLNSRSAWPAYNTYERELTITNRNGTVSAYNTTGSGLLYGTEATASTLSTYNHWYVYAFDGGGDTYAYLSTGTYFNTGIYSEADHGIGANENGPSASNFPGDDYALSSAAFDAGTNDASDSGANTTYDGRAFSMWIKN